MNFFKNLGLKLFNKEKNIVEETEQQEDNDSQYHYEFVNYSKVSWIKLILIKKFCLHDWNLYHAMNINVNQNGIPEKVRHTLICKKCGEIKRIEL